jgi:hypothetical protein
MCVLKSLNDAERDVKMIQGVSSFQVLRIQTLAEASTLIIRDYQMTAVDGGSF